MKVGTPQSFRMLLSLHEFQFQYLLLGSMHHSYGLFIMVSLGYVVKFPAYSCCFSILLPSEVGNMKIYSVLEMTIPSKQKELYKKCGT